ncbi:cytochrome c oxidase subunit 3 [Tritonibacter mobilis]|jgi:cytochrome c oxidase subunit 3|uniref:cytochrome c oxidase subunit 3 n=1 Tax=Tritonibacter mobilis TaxID=379347 RepID=UPI000806DB0D|nr:cytochrome c oxidase subunit 3 [Tritonibacter mobilis]NKX38234.1 cytochrome c oxidase subunit 3 [Rhodobacteraceae bacterium R_SAG5]NKX73217.1 cytochrome c oxidase subunit 3 [Rhodobacteraceae bacterium R_SAG3]GLP84710.1 cytochrome B562 [Tritonibacter mobilis]SDW10484.1 cytochrome c oxidase subunit 3 [Tritonibacter mobilis]
MAHAKNHDFHILPPSIWPLLSSVGAFVMLFGAVLWMHDVTAWLFWAGLVAVLYSAFCWWSETVAENKAGDHTPVVLIGLRYGFILFVMSEVMFFFAWFWSFFKHAMYPMERYVGSEYVAPDIYPVDAFHLPLINTLVLLLSGCAVTWAHHALVHENDRKGLINGLAIGIALGIFFTALQGYEYVHLLHKGWEFGGDEFYSNFFMATGFHGFHVILGTIFLIVCLIRAMKGDFTPKSHAGFEMAAWYWHFVDVVWLFLFVAVYIWGTAGLAH